MKKKLLSITTIVGILFTSFTSFVGNVAAVANQYTVAPGDVLWKIAYNHNVTTQDLMEWNRLSSDMIYVGQKLYVSQPPTSTHIVQKGETLWIIANKYQVTTKQIIDSNGLSSEMIYPGQVLSIPTPASSLAKVHTVTQGETLWIIANKYNLTVSQLKSQNNLSSDMIYVGQTLNVSTNVSKEKVPVPPMLADGIFPLKVGTYSPFTNTFGIGRQWNSDGSFTTRSHDGVDIMANKDTPIYSATNGTVINKGWNEYGGWRLTIRANDSTAIYYAHMSRYASNIGMGSYVGKGQLIGYVGDTGYGPEGTAGKFVPHLHFGIYDTKNDWKAIDPYPYLKYWESK